jgi:hypothetical protein
MPRFMSPPPGINLRRSPIPVRISGVPQINEACLEYLHIEMVAQFLESSPPSTPALAPSDPNQAVALKLERVGFRVGQKIAERACVARPRFGSELDKIKFLCKEFWSLVFRKPQVDNLRTNNRGTYVLTDNRFRLLSTIGGPDAKDLAVRYTFYPCGLIRGCLAALGLPCTVVADASSAPVCTFTVKLILAQQPLSPT